VQLSRETPVYVNAISEVFDGTRKRTASLIGRLKQNAAATQIVVLAASCDQAAADVIAAGADGCLLKQEKRTALLEAIRAVARGEKRHSAAVVDALVQATPTEPPQLTARQLEVLRLAADGQTNEQIAGTLGLSPSTVRYHLQNVYRRLNVKGRAQAVAEAIRLGYL
jgi:DNA-binding NarL/FixJ family response regulator